MGGLRSSTFMISYVKEGIPCQQESMPRKCERKDNFRDKGRAVLQFHPSIPIALQE